jgi:signal transduction histidine kinase
MGVLSNFFTREMAEHILNFSVMLISTYYLYFKILNIKLNKNKLLLSAVMFVAITTITILFDNFFGSNGSDLIFIGLTVVSLIFLSRIEFYVSICTSIISIGIFYCFRTISTILTATMGWLLSVDLDKHEILLLVISAVVEIALTLIFVNIKRFRNGLSFLRDKENVGIGLILSGLSVFFIFLKNDLSVLSDNLLFAMIFGNAVSIVGFVIWIRKSISRKYLENLRTKELAKYDNELSEKDSQIQALKENNEYLGKIVHRDNHLLGSLQQTIALALSNENADETALRQTLGDMLTQFDERSDLILKEQAEHKILPTTNLPLIDGALSHMYIKACAHKISLDVSVQADLRLLAGDKISQTELETLICDHIKDAIISVESGKIENGRVLLCIGCTNGIFEISVKDNGPDFDTEVLSKLGKERITTHSSTGGTGTGFVTTFQTLKKSGASLEITEYKNKIPFTKSVTFRFDNQNTFSIISYRYETLKQEINRTDTGFTINNLQ